MHKLFNVGCKLNQCEGFCLLKKFAHNENVIIVNTCCVTKEAEVKSYKKYRHALRTYPTSRIIITGCLCQLHPEKFPHAHDVIDNVNRNSLIRGVFPEPKKSRYFLKIEDGCQSECTFCIVPKVRERIVSKLFRDVENEINWAVSRGYQEIVLVGANIGLYGTDVGVHLIDLLKMLKHINDLPRMRLSSIEPLFINAALIDTVKELPFCRHFHIPLQSGNDFILARMGRKYDMAYLKKSIALINENFEDVMIGGDVIVGFPGEGAREFQDTYDFINASPLNHLHIFPYSPRPGTAAYAFGDPVSHGEKKERLWVLKRLMKKKNYHFRTGLKNKIFDTVVEKIDGSDGTHFFTGLTDNYVRVRFSGTPDGQPLQKIKVTRVTEDETYGIIIGPDAR